VNEACPLCGRTANEPRASIRDLLLNGVCAGVLLAILAPAFWFSERWLEGAGQRAVDHKVWREPVESWYRRFEWIFIRAFAM
jgi:hypothetical protein